MKLKFKSQSYQTKAVESVIDCFTGQPYVDGISFINNNLEKNKIIPEEDGFKNHEIEIPDHIILGNIKNVQKKQNLNQSTSLNKNTNCINLDIEMETGTGKTYCYIKTIFELNLRYGWSKFIIIVPSIAIREGVFKSLQITKDHFAETYTKKSKFFIYNSKRLHDIENFSSDAGINIMIINIQAFNARKADNLRINYKLDDFQSRKPIDVIKSNNPILILDEPQKMAQATLEALPKFNPLMILRYSATHKIQHNLIHRLDAVDAYNQKLVKKIEVLGIESNGSKGSNSYLYLESIDISKSQPIARLEFEIKLSSGDIRKKVRKILVGDNLFNLSNKLEQYKDRYIVTQIDKVKDTIEFSNGLTILAGSTIGDVTENDIRRIQIRETIKTHFEKERRLFNQKIKVLSLFFIDEVKKYRDYEQEDEKGIYAKIFEEEYDELLKEIIEDSNYDDKNYISYIKSIKPFDTHNGYFSIDKKSKKFIDPSIDRGTGESKDVDAYDIILKDKERLLSFEENTRFIFSHSALREGWDNPNVFVLCMLKNSSNEILRRQEVGRGLRLCVTQTGERVDNLNIVHEVNQLTVIANESYKSFVNGLQSEIVETLSSRPKQASKAFFTGKIIQIKDGDFTLSEAMAAQIYRYLVKNDYITISDEISELYYQSKEKYNLAPLPDELKEYSEGIFLLIDSLFSDESLPKINNARNIQTNSLNKNFEKTEFIELWNRINRKAVYKVNFDSKELIEKCINALNEQLKVKSLFYQIEIGEQIETINTDKIRDGEIFKSTSSTITSNSNNLSRIDYDLIGKISDETYLTRSTVAKILNQITKDTFAKYRQNPENFIFEVSRIINEQKSATIIEKLEYSSLDESYDISIFTANQSVSNFEQISQNLKKHIYNYVVTDSNVEKNFVEELDKSDEVVVYAKLPRGFLIPTPIGDYNPDWAISFKEGSVKHIYFVAETKGNMSSMSLRQSEKLKINCAQKFFNEINSQNKHHKIKYNVVDSYSNLIDLVVNQ